MSDFTVIFLTVNKVPEKWAEYHMKVLKEAIVDCSAVISVSKIPMDFGTNILQTEPESSSNIYWQMLKAAKIATTPYIAVAEDDVLYCREHFMPSDPRTRELFRPQMDEFAYNMTRWSLFTWGEPMYSWRHRIGNFALLAPRELTIEALEERFAKYPNGTPDDATGELGKPRSDKRLRLTPRKIVEYWTTVPIVQLSHPFGTEPFQRNFKKRHAMVRAYDIPFWGRAEELVRRFI
jgi:hypothetical protein